MRNVPRKEPSLFWVTLGGWSVKLVRTIWLCIGGKKETVKYHKALLPKVMIKYSIDVNYLTMGLLQAKMTHPLRRNVRKELKLRRN